MTQKNEATNMATSRGGGLTVTSREEGGVKGSKKKRFLGTQKPNGSIAGVLLFKGKPKGDTNSGKSASKAGAAWRRGAAASSSDTTRSNPPIRRSIDSMS